MSKIHAIIAGVNSGKTNYLIRKAVIYALSGKSVLYVDPEHNINTINKKFFAYRENDAILARNINVLSVPVRNTSVLFEHLNFHNHYDVIIIDLPTMMVKEPQELNQFIADLGNEYDVLYTVQANRTFYEDCVAGVKSEYILDNVANADVVSVIFKTQEPENSEMIIFTEYQYDANSATLADIPTSCYYMEVTDNKQVKLMAFGESPSNIFDIDPELLLAKLNTRE